MAPPPQAHVIARPWLLRAADHCLELRGAL